MTITLLVYPQNIITKVFYMSHGHYHFGDCGYDLYVPETTRVPAGSRGFMVDLGIKCQMTHEKFFFSPTEYLSYYIYPRSSISKTPLRLSNSVGIIDSGYTGNLKIALDNLSDSDYEIKQGDRLVQLCHPTLTPFKVDVKITEAIRTTSRGEGGFGSTGQSVQTQQTAHSAQLTYSAGTAQATHSAGPTHSAYTINVHPQTRASASDSTISIKKGILHRNPSSIWSNDERVPADVELYSAQDEIVQLYKE